MQKSQNQQQLSSYLGCGQFASIAKVNSAYTKENETIFLFFCNMMWWINLYLFQYNFYNDLFMYDTNVFVSKNFFLLHHFDEIWFELYEHIYVNIWTYTLKHQKIFIKFFFVCCCCCVYCIRISYHFQHFFSLQNHFHFYFHVQY